MPHDPPCPSSPLPAGLVQQLSDRVLSQPADRREQELAQLLAQHPQHAAALRRLLADIVATERLLDAGYPAAVELPQQIGPFRVLRRLGEGAFGEVYLCRQTAPLQREVAVKVLRPGAGDRSTLARFDNERQLLASLQHPAIAQVFDAGTLPDGRPYFVMDHVDGSDIVHYCDARSLSIEQRLDLFIDLARGVQHAHSRRIVHRDLKPANVLVVEHDGRPQPKIIDFGIAKVLQGDPGATPAATETGRIVGTPGYMSPEQAMGLPGEVDARADVFALGVLLYQLLVGELPWRGPVTDRDPIRPSTLVASEPVRSASIASRRSTEVRRLASRLRGDLDWIVLRALQHAKEARYQTVQDLVQDLQRHRNSEPVQAGPPSTALRLRKFTRRHRLAVTVTAGALFTAASVATVAVAMQWRVDASERARFAGAMAAAQRLFQRANDPRLEDAPRSDELRQAVLHEALDLQQQLLAEAAPDRQQLWLRARTLDELAGVHYQLAQYSEGLDAAAAACRDFGALVAIDPASRIYRAGAAAAFRNLGRCALLNGDHEQGARASAAAVEELDQLCDEDADAHGTLLAKTLVEYAAALGRCGDPQGQLSRQQRAIDVLERHLSRRPDDAEAQRDLVRFQCGLGNLLIRRKDFASAQEALLRARHLAETLAGITLEERARVWHRLGMLYESESMVADAIAAFDRAIALHGQLLQLNPGRQLLRIQLARIRSSLCELRAMAGSVNAALQAARLAAADVEALPAGHPRWQSITVETLARIGTVCMGADRRQDLELAHQWLQRAARLAISLPIDEPASALLQLRSRIDLDLVLGRLGQPETAAAWQSVVAAAAEAGSDRWWLRAAYGLATAQCAEGDFTAARATLASLRRECEDRSLFEVPPVAVRELDRLAQRIERSAGDASRLERLAEAMSRKGDWHSLFIAAEATAAAIELSGPGRDDLPARSAALDRRLMEAVERSDAIDAGDPLPALAVAWARLRAASLQPDRSRRAEQLAAILPVLDRLREEIVPDCWDERALAAGRADLARCQLSVEGSTQRSPRAQR